jgi:hypothetical protein
MPAVPARYHAAVLQRQLRSLLGHAQIVTQAYGHHLLIKRLDDEELTVVAAPHRAQPQSLWRRLPQP